MLFFSKLITIVAITSIVILLSTCTQEPYVEQMNTANELIHQGKLNNSKEQLKQAIKSYGQVYSYALAALEKKYDALLNLAILHAYEGQFSACIEVMNEAYQLKREEVSMFYYWGQCYANQAKITANLEEREKFIVEAARVYEEGLLLDAQDYEINYGLGVLYGFIAQDQNRGLEYLVTANSINPKDINTLFALANLMFQVGQVDESRKYYNAILEYSEPDSSTYQQAQRNLSKLQ